MKKISFSLLFIVLFAVISFSCSNVSDGGGAGGSCGCNSTGGTSFPIDSVSATSGSCDCNSTGSTSGGGSNTDDELYRHSIGRIYYSDGTSSYNYISTKNPLGFIVSINEDGTVDKLLSLDGDMLAFGNRIKYKVSTTDDDGEANCLDILNKVDSDYLDSLDAVNWCRNFDTNIEGFGAGTWYLPSLNELKAVFFHYKFFERSYDSLIENGYTGKLHFLPGRYWSSTLYRRYDRFQNENFYDVNIQTGAVYDLLNVDEKINVRAMYKFKYE